MKIEKKKIPESMKKTMGGVTTDEEPASKTLKSLRELEAINSKSNIKAVFFINLTYLIGFICLTIITLQSANLLIISTMGITTVGALIFNIFTYNESKRTIKNTAIIKKLGLMDEA